MFEPGLLTWTTIWLAGSIFVLVRHWRPGAGVGLLLGYVLSFAALHGFPALVYLLPWYSSPTADLTIMGLRESAIAMTGLVIGAELAARFGRRSIRHRQPEARQPVDAALVNSYLAVGILLYAVVAPIASWIPTIGTLVSMGATLAVVGLALKHWNAVADGRQGRAAVWLFLTALFPIVTVIGQGFLGYGYVALLSVIVFAASWTRTRLRHVLAGILTAYLGLSVYVTYMRDRAEIRDVVWSAATLEKRASRLWATATEPEWFNPSASEHLLRIDQRLNQNFLVGSAVDYLDNGFAGFGYGQTFLAALVAPIPRALWPDKPFVAGGAELVSDYTGYRFYGTTSVGIGQVMECYVNFGSWGVLLGFVVIGAAIVVVDRGAAHSLQAGRMRTFLLWYFPGLTLLQVGGSLSELTGTAAASLLMAYLLNVTTALWIRPLITTPDQVQDPAPERKEVQVAQ